MDVARYAVGRGLTVLWVVPGLLREGPRVVDALRETAPDTLAITTSEPEVAGLAAFLEDPDEDDGWTEEPYAIHLSRYGAVAHPPPAYLHAVAWAREHDLPVTGVDLPEDDYDDAFTRHMGVFQLLRHGRRLRRLEKKPPKADDASAFTLAWDAKLQRTRAIRQVEERRRDHVRDTLVTLARDAPVVAVVDVVLRPGLEAEAGFGAMSPQP